MFLGKSTSLVKNSVQVVVCGEYSDTFCNLSKKQTPKNFSEQELKGITLFKQQNYEQALVLFRELVKESISPDKKCELWGHIGESYLAMERSQDAIEAFEASVNIDDTVYNGHIMVLLCNLYLENNRFSALEKLTLHLSVWPNFIEDSQYFMIESAKKQFNKDLVISIVSNCSEKLELFTENFLVKLLNACIFVSALSQAESLIDKVEKKFGNIAWLITFKAQISFDRKNYPKVVTLLTDELIQALPKWAKINHVYHLRGLAYDKLAQYDLAFDSFTRMANIVEELANQEENDIKDYVKSYLQMPLHQLSGMYLNEEVPRLSNNNPKSLVFMIGFPRSGTTLLDSIIATQENVVILSETGTLDAVRNIIVTKFNKSYPEDITSLTLIEISELRQTYFDYVNSLDVYMTNDKYQNNTILVDKMPLNVIHLPLILLLFPDAKIIFSLRHPLDVCLSNFQQNYLLNSEMTKLISFEHCVKRYNEVFTLFEHYHSYLPLSDNLLFVKYEELTDKLPEVANKVFTFLDIKKDDKYLEFYKHARERIINTSSRNQVTEPLYHNSRYKYNNYLTNIESFIPCLQKFITKYGYKV